MKLLEEFTEAYIEALLFTSTNEDGETMEDMELTAEARLDIEADCRSFWRRFGCYVVSEVCEEAFADSVTQAGHDFHMTRNGHDCGFWEEEWPQPYRVMLTDAARGYGELDVYPSDGLLHVS